MDASTPKVLLQDTILLDTSMNQCGFIVTWHTSLSSWGTFQAVLVEPGDDIIENTKNRFIRFALEKSMISIRIHDELFVLTASLLVQGLAHRRISYSIGLSMQNQQRKRDLAGSSMLIQVKFGKFWSINPTLRQIA